MKEELPETDHRLKIDVLFIGDCKCDACQVRSLKQLAEQLEAENSGHLRIATPMTFFGVTYPATTRVRDIPYPSTLN